MTDLGLTHWNLSPLSLAVYPALAAAYLLFAGSVPAWRKGSFITGLFLMFIAIHSPLGWLAQHNLMSAHMTAHVMILMMAAPLLLLGFPQQFFRKSLGHSFSGIFSQYLWIPWLAGVGTMWFWHFPPVHDGLLHAGGTAICGPGSLSADNSALANLVALTYYPSLLLAGMLMSWPLVSPVKRLKGPPAVIYLFTACIGCSLLGIILTFSPQLIYEQHIATPGAIPGWLQMSAANDQQVAGLIMWVPGCLLYATAAIALMLQWFREEEKYNQPANMIQHETNR